jgi:hypothetical protein
MPTIDRDQHSHTLIKQGQTRNSFRHPHLYRADALHLQKVHLVAQRPRVKAETPPLGPGGALSLLHRLPLGSGGHRRVAGKRSALRVDVEDALKVGHRPAEGQRLAQSFTQFRIGA